ELAAEVSQLLVELRRFADHDVLGTKGAERLGLGVAAHDVDHLHAAEPGQPVDHLPQRAGRRRLDNGTGTRLTGALEVRPGGVGIDDAHRALLVTDARRQRCTLECRGYHVFGPGAIASARRTGHALLHRRSGPSSTLAHTQA